MTARRLLHPTPRTRLHPVRGRHQDCGTVALASLADIPTSEAAELVRQVTGRKRILGTTPPQLIEAMRLAGIDCADHYRVFLRPRPTVSEFLRARHRWHYRAMIVGHGSREPHWIAVSGATWLDHSHRSPSELCSCVMRRRALVEGFIPVFA